MENGYEIEGKNVKFSFIVPTKKIYNDSVKNITDEFYLKFEEMILDFVKQNHLLEEEK